MLYYIRRRVAYSPGGVLKFNDKITGHKGTGQPSADHLHAPKIDAHETHVTGKVKDIVTYGTKNTRLLRTYKNISN